MVYVKTGKKRGNPNLKKGEQPANLIGKGFDAHPEHINRYGVPSDAISLRKMIQKMGNEEIQVILKSGKGKTAEERILTMTRFERILFEWFETQNSRKQEMLMAYGFGKPVETVNVQGELKVIRVALKKKTEQSNDQPNESQDNGSTE